MVDTRKWLPKKFILPYCIQEKGLFKVEDLSDSWQSHHQQKLFVSHSRLTLTGIFNTK